MSHAFKVTKKEAQIAGYNPTAEEPWKLDEGKVELMSSPAVISFLNQPGFRLAWLTQELGVEVHVRVVREGARRRLDFTVASTEKHFYLTYDAYQKHKAARGDKIMLWLKDRLAFLLEREREKSG